MRQPDWGALTFNTPGRIPDKVLPCAITQTETKGLNFLIKMSVAKVVISEPRFLRVGKLTSP